MKGKDDVPRRRAPIREKCPTRPGGGRRATTSAMRHLIVTLLCLALPLAFAVPPAAVGPAVELAVEADGEQPIGEVIIVKLTMTNTGKEPVRWWSGGPGSYPGAEYFLIDARLARAEEWQRVRATNGRYGQGSGGDQQLKNGESIVIPLAVPFKPESDGGVDLRVTTATWQAAKPVELYVRLNENKDALDARRARMIAGALPDAAPFWRHVAEKYADSIVIDAMLKLVTVDNAPIAAGAARVLAAQPDLPENAGGILAPLLALWLPRYQQTGTDMVAYYLLNAGLKTRSESVRQVALDLLRDSPHTRVRDMLVDALRLSPGDEEWLQRTRGALIGVAQAKTTDAKLAQQAQDAIDWVESRLKRLEEEQKPTTSEKE